MSQTTPPDPWGTPPESGTEEGAEGGGFSSAPPPSFQPPPPEHEPSAQSEPPQEPPPNYPPPPSYPPPPGYPPPGYPPPPGAGAPPPGSAYPPPPGYAPGGYQPPPSGGYPPPPGGYQPGGYDPYGLPTPPPVGPYASQAGTLAGWWLRVGATIIDGLVLVVPNIVLDLLLGRAGEYGVGQVLFAAYIIIMLGRLGQTVGNMAVHTRVVDAAGGQTPGYGKAAIRWIVMLVLNITIIGGFLNILWPLWDNRNQTLHDKAAGTLVVRT